MFFERAVRWRNDFTLSTICVLSQLSSGKFGSTHLALHEPSGLKFALKVFHANTIMANGFEQLVELERDCMYELTTKKSCCPFVVKLIHFFGDSRNCYLAIELCQFTLFEAMSRKDLVISLPDVKYIVGSVALALEAIHSLDTLHRDIKPETIFINSKGHVKVGNFGIAKKALVAFTFCGACAFSCLLVCLTHTHTYRFI